MYSLLVFILKDSENRRSSRINMALATPRTDHEDLVSCRSKQRGASKPLSKAKDEIVAVGSFKFVKIYCSNDERQAASMILHKPLESRVMTIIYYDLSILYRSCICYTPGNRRMSIDNSIFLGPDAGLRATRVYRWAIWNEVIHDNMSADLAVEHHRWTDNI